MRKVYCNRKVFINSYAGEASPPRPPSQLSLENGWNFPRVDILEAWVAAGGRRAQFPALVVLRRLFENLRSSP